MGAYYQHRHIELDKVGNGKKRAMEPPGGDCHDMFGYPDSTPVPHHRITRPPGGESSDIFGSSPTSTPPSTPRKVKNYMASTIFSPEEGQQAKARQRPDDDSFKRLFGLGGQTKSPVAATNGDLTDGQLTPRGKNHQKSNILFRQEVNGTNGVSNGVNGTNGTPNGTNGTTNGTNGIAHGTNGTANGTNGHTNGTANGHTNGTNGHTNGTNGLNGHGHNGINGTNGYQNGSGSISGSSSGSVTPNGSINGDYKSNGHSNGGSMPGTPSRRIPPGGYSSKLW